MRPEPVIPDHEVLRMVGGGSYGEVWLASGVTGAMRAVKVVRREDFDDESTFEREFEGILKYEPLSRDHPGLVHILHVGRGVDIHKNSFYYYVMELGDDVYSGTSINPVEYEARNLLTDMKHSGGTPHDPDEVITIGLSLSEALSFLHDKGLVHRDVKPSNIIFVDGNAKLADIGLVAAGGQRTFVGTEGFVPPEGPGSVEADVYALGKLLYEMATGKDRLNFPELPDELPAVMHKKRWLGLNQLICDACEPRRAKRNIKTASDMTEGLRRIQLGRKLKRSRDSKRMVAAAVVSLIGLLVWGFGSQLKSLAVNVMRGDFGEYSQPESLKEVEYGFVKVLSDPPGAEVYDGDGDFIDYTPLRNLKMESGTSYNFEFRMNGFRTSRETGVVKVNETQILEHVMVVYSPPVSGQTWVDHHGMTYRPVENHHVSEGHINNNMWQRYQSVTKPKGAPASKRVRGVYSQQPALVTADEAIKYAKWLSNTALARGYLSEMQHIYVQLNKDLDTSKFAPKAKANKKYPFRTVVKNIPFASMEVHSDPEGAIVYIDDVFVGYSPVYRNHIKPGARRVTVTYEGYRKMSKIYHLKPKAYEKIDVKMKRNNSVVFGEKWTNSLGMQFVPVYDDHLLVSVWETRISDFKKYGELSKSQRANAENLDGNLPVSGITRKQAMDFCKRLTKVDLKTEIIPEGSHYRLLTDLEWSSLAGLEEDPRQTPAMREAEISNVFPWGDRWLPSESVGLVGNFAGEEMSSEGLVDTKGIIANYDDGHIRAAPVGSFPANAYGIHDLAGNVYEWVSDSYSGGGDYGVLRGGSWGSHTKEHLYIRHRNLVKLSSLKPKSDFGFRIVLERVPVDEALEQ